MYIYISQINYILFTGSWGSWGHGWVGIDLFQISVSFCISSGIAGWLDSLDWRSGSWASYKEWYQLCWLVVPAIWMRPCPSFDAGSHDFLGQYWDDNRGMVKQKLNWNQRPLWWSVATTRLIVIPGESVPPIGVWICRGALREACALNKKELCKGNLRA